MVKCQEVLSLLNVQIAGNVRMYMINHALTATPEFSVMEQYGGIVGVRTPAEVFGPVKSLFVSVFISEQQIGSLLTATSLMKKRNAMKSLCEDLEQGLALSFHDLLMSQFYSRGKRNDYAGLRSQSLQTKRWKRPFSFDSLVKILPSAITKNQVPYLGTMSVARLTSLRTTAPNAACFVAGDKTNEVSKLGFDVVRIGAVDCVASSFVPQRRIFVWQKNAIEMRVIRDEEGGDFLLWSGLHCFDRGLDTATRGLMGTFTVHGNFHVPHGACWLLI